MRIVASGLLVIGALTFAATLAAQQPASHPDFSGAYERYGNVFGQPTPQQAADKAIPPRNSPAPLRIGSPPSAKRTAKARRSRPDM
jgi:hypothetical protein